MRLCMFISGGSFPGGFSLQFYPACKEPKISLRMSSQKEGARKPAVLPPDSLQG